MVFHLLITQFPLLVTSDATERCFLFFAGMYDGNEHTPKLLQCSHTVCLHCLTRIAASQTRDTGSFRCPICRELITIPRGGVSALPPSFLVNQLLDLMSRQRREVSILRILIIHFFKTLNLVCKQYSPIIHVHSGLLTVQYS